MDKKFIEIKNHTPEIDFRNFKPRKYNISIQYFEGEEYLPVKRIDYESQLVTTDAKDIQLLIYKDAIWYNQHEPDLLSEMMASELSKIIYPVQVRIDKKGRFLGVTNWDTIVHNRWNKRKQDIIQKYNSETARSFYTFFERNLKSKSIFEKSMQYDWFWNLLFHPKYVDKSSILVLNQKCIRNNTIDYSFAQYVDENQNIKEKAFIQEGDILINSTGQGTAGRCAFVKKLPKGKRVVIDSHILRLRGKSYYESQCLSYSLFSIENLLQSFIDGSTGQGEFDKVRLFNLLSSIPNDNERTKQIASILSSLDDKIELNNRINTELEAMAKTLYDYWFVQFDFPDAKDKPYRSSGGKMVYNEILKREIPEGWEVGVFNDWLLSTKTGDWGKESKEGTYTERVYCVRGADINGLNGKGEVNAPQRYILKNNIHKRLEANDFIIEISGGSPTQSTARIAMITKEVLERFDTDVICSNFCKAITLTDHSFVYNFQQEWQRLYDAKVFFGYEGKTSGIKNFLFDSFMTSYNIVKPSKGVVLQYNSISKEIERKRQANLKENQELASLRDWLLPMLMNGQVGFKDEIKP